MNMVQKWRRFWTLKARANGGFTLVELIVVIAILAILAGIAVPAYSGYINKAKEAGDQTLLSAVNTAFAAACLDKNVDITTLDSSTAVIKLTSGKISSVAPGDVTGSFELFYGENMNIPFEVITGLVFDVDKYIFVDTANSDGVTVGYNGAKVSLNAAQIQSLKDSSFYGEGMTSEKLLQQVDSVANIAQAMGSVQGIMNTQEFGEFAMNALGVKTSAEYEAKVNDMVLTKLGWAKDFDITQATEAESKEYFAALQQIKGNALVLYTAQQTTQLGAEEASKLLDGINSTTIRNNMLNGTAAEQQIAMNQAALAYGMYYGYASSKGVDTSGIDAFDVMDALDGKDEGFTQYMQDAQSGKDMAAYLEALKMIDQSATGNPAAVEQLVTNGFVDLNDVLTGTMGK